MELKTPEQVKEYWLWLESCAMLEVVSGKIPRKKADPRQLEKDVHVTMQRLESWTGKLSPWQKAKLGNIPNSLIPNFESPDILQKTIFLAKEFSISPANVPTKIFFFLSLFSF
jgi:hypothetical protein